MMLPTTVTNQFDAKARWLAESHQWTKLVAYMTPNYPSAVPAIKRHAMAVDGPCCMDSNEMLRAQEQDYATESRRSMDPTHRQMAEDDLAMVRREIERREQLGAI